MLLHLDDVLVDIRRLDVVPQRVGICDEEVDVLPVPRLVDIVGEAS